MILLTVSFGLLILFGVLLWWDQDKGRWIWVDGNFKTGVVLGIATASYAWLILSVL